MKILVALLILMCSVPALAHKGNPWHGGSLIDKNLGVGFGTAGLASAFLEPKAPGTPTTFKFTYKTEVPLLVTSATRLVAGVVNSSSLESGVVKNAEIIKMRISDATAEYKSVEFEFTISEPGVYHFFFGPWDGVTLYLGEDPPVEVETQDGKVEWVAKVAGDVAMGVNPNININGQPGMAIWVQQLFIPATEKYKTFKLQKLPDSMSEENLPKRMSSVHDALKEIGLKQ